METVSDSFLREQLLERRQRLQTAAAQLKDNRSVMELLREVDAALDRMQQSSYGLCAVCHDPIEKERLLADPLLEYCLDHLTPQQRRALEEDLGLALKVQDVLLPERNLSFRGWNAHYHYEASGIVSGDYCDLVTQGDDLLFLVGDVSGKGVAASMLMAQLHAIFRTLISLNLPLDQLMIRANRIFCESTLADSYATLVGGKAAPSGVVEICNAGHNPPFLIQSEQAVRLEATGLPVGMFCTEEFSIRQVTLAEGNSLFLYTDGLTEARDPLGREYGEERLARWVLEHRQFSPIRLVRACLEDLTKFQSGAPRSDDLTLMAIRRGGNGVQYI